VGRRVSISTAILIAFLAIAASGCNITISGPTGVTGSNPVISTQPAGSTNSEQIARAVFNAINADRKSAGLPALQWSTNLVNSAHAHNLAMQKANQLAHQIPGEAAFGDREHQAGIQWQWAAENIGYTTDQSVNGALGLHKAMMAEKPPDDGHRQNILAKEAAILGVDILIDKQNGKLWLTEDFAHL
jgi:uncharacterized protein YkwD